MGLSREDLLKKLNIIPNGGPDLEAVVKKAMTQFELDTWKEPSDHVTTSFYASQFPGDEKSCSRKMLYQLMNVPYVDPIPPKLRGQTEMGNAAEYWIVHRLMTTGKVLSSELPETYGDKVKQTKFSDELTWLSGATDLIMDMSDEGYEYILPVDIKSKDHNVIQDMRVGARGYDIKHYYQVQAYIYFCRKFHEEMGWKLKPAKAGMLYYVSRQDPTFVKQFYFDMDEEAIARGIELLTQTKEDWHNDVLPERPSEWKWTEEPCKWCPFKREACKKDWKEGVEKL